jgi:hypothetical protein
VCVVQLTGIRLFIVVIIIMYVTALCVKTVKGRSLLKEVISALANIRKSFLMANPDQNKTKGGSCKGWYDL